MRKIFLTVIFALAAFSLFAQKVWTLEEAKEWQEEVGWRVGCNYVPSYAVNQYDMWGETTFNPEIIDHELGMMEELGFNTIRVYLHENLWYADKVGFKKRISKLLDIAAKHGIKVAFAFFTNGGKHDINFTLGPQPDLPEGEHNSRWIPSPGKAALDNPYQWGQLKKYVQDILKTYKNDDRILYWCLYNEPENPNGGCDVIDFLPDLYSWAWEVRPSQPLTSPVWLRPGQKGVKTRLDIVAYICMNSDIISFHCYYGAGEVKTFIKMLERFRRPMVCEEYLSRRQGSTFFDIMPILKSSNVGAINWGFINGRSRSNHIYKADGTPYDEKEVEFIKEITH